VEEVEEVEEEQVGYKCTMKSTLFEHRFQLGEDGGEDERVSETADLG
jgi:hypothetical protein